jgi:creatinine amidohydrolase
VHLLTTATSVEESDRRARVAILPIGSFEQHGNHLPLTTDTVVACVIAQHLAARYELFVLPPVTISCSHEHEGFAGTVSVSAGTLISILNDIRESLARSGIMQLVLVNGHGGNYVLSNIVQEANVEARRLALFPGRTDFVTARRAAEMETSVTEDMHGGEWETSILLHACPDLVRSTYDQNDHDAPERPHLLITGMQGYTSTGIIGRPSAASAAKGKTALGSLVETFDDLLKALAG